MLKCTIAVQRIPMSGLLPNQKLYSTFVCGTPSCGAQDAGSRMVAWTPAENAGDMCIDGASERNPKWDPQLDDWNGQGKETKQNILTAS
ncbi:hypothetical protein Y1Q_0003171 [Alligator mississippiensis]|uniref:Uncharacterized protein n=1 Tax=Alligator mississippiensis TaxID=8496 RepID=A0A151MDS7_ALLMI|nr:hypothetical protein Y1Q_0003171 [Alligator mississippiensis]